MMKNSRGKHSLNSSYKGVGLNQYEIAALRKSLGMGKSRNKYSELFHKRKESKTSRALDKSMKGSKPRKPNLGYHKNSTGNILRSSRIMNESCHVSPFLRKKSRVKEEMSFYQRNSSSNVTNGNNSSILGVRRSSHVLKIESSGYKKRKKRTANPYREHAERHGYKLIEVSKKENLDFNSRQKKRKRHSSRKMKSGNAPTGERLSKGSFEKDYKRKQKDRLSVKRKSMASPFRAERVSEPNTYWDKKKNKRHAIRSHRGSQDVKVRESSLKKSSKNSGRKSKKRLAESRDYLNVSHNNSNLLSNSHLVMDKASLVPSKKKSFNRKDYSFREKSFSRSKPIRSNHQTPLVDSSRTGSNEVSKIEIEERSYKKVSEFSSKKKYSPFERRRESDHPIRSHKRKLSYAHASKSRTHRPEKKASSRKKKRPKFEAGTRDHYSKTRRHNQLVNGDMNSFQYVQNLSRTKAKKYTKSEANLANDIKLNDFQFLFNKKLSNVEKMSLLQLRKQRNDMNSSRQRNSTSSNHKPFNNSQINNKTHEPTSSHQVQEEHAEQQQNNYLPNFNKAKLEELCKRQTAISSRISKKKSSKRSSKSRKLGLDKRRKSRPALKDYSVVIREQSEESLSRSNYIRSRKGSIKTPTKDSIPKGPSFRIDSRRNSKDNSFVKRSSKNAFSRKVSKQSKMSDSGMKSRRVSFEKIPKSNVSRREERKFPEVDKSKVFAKRMNNKRSSLPIQNRAQKMADELDFEFNMNKISMTPDVSRNNSFDGSCDSEERKKRQSKIRDLDSSNSKLVMNTLVSEATKTEDQYTDALEYERRNLIEYIRSYTKRNGKLPRTSLQFYKILKMIGKGSFGKVHLGIHILSKRKVAIKCIDKAYIKEERAQRKIVQEVKILRSVNHPNIIKILEVFENKKFVFIVTEYACRGDLLKYMRENGVFREHKAKPISSQILAGLEYCHNKRILHRDVKLDNILLDNNMHVKICDFGVSRFMTIGDYIRERCGTPAYIAPEVISGKGYKNFQADVWSLGVLMYALTTGTIPFKAKTIPDLHKLILNDDFTFPSNAKLSSVFKDLLRNMLIKDPKKRITVEEIWQHPWFEGFTHYRTRRYVHGINIKDCDKKVAKKLEKLGFNQGRIMETLKNNQMNHISATYFLLTESKKK